jgi:NAD+ kinase
MKTIAIVLNPEKPDAIELVKTLVPHLQERGVSVVIEREAANVAGFPQLARDTKELVLADFALVLGGDGTLLRASRLMAPAGVPMLGIRFGKFGFMTEIEPANAEAAVNSVLDTHYQVEERTMLSADVRRAGSSIAKSAALNDVVIGKGPLARMLRLETYVSGKYITTYQSDGLIIATPTGSTAYSLSAGGPLVTPDLNVAIITPICPHTLNVRPLLVSSRETVKVVIAGDTEETVMLTVDGQIGVPLEEGDEVLVGEAEYKTRLIKVGDTTFFEKLQSRLRWGGRFDCEG